MNTKFLNQAKLIGTVTPVNTAIAAGDDGQVVAEKLQGQINVITPGPIAALTTHSANTTGTTLLANTNGYQAVVGASITVGAGTWLLSYTASVQITMNTSFAQDIYSTAEIYNVTASAVVAKSETRLCERNFQNGYDVYAGGAAGATVVATVAGSTVFQIYMNAHTTYASVFNSTECVITGIQIR